MTKPNGTQAIKTLKDFGLDYPFTEVDIQKVLTSKQKKLVKDATLVIVPPLSWRELITKFDAKQPHNTYIWSELWDKYDFGNSWSVCFVLPELKYTSQTVKEQRQSLKKEGLDSISPREYIMLQAQLRDTGDMVDKTTWCRFVGEEDKTIGGSSVVPSAHVDGDGRLHLCGSRVDDAWGDGGVRRVVRVKPLDFAPSLESFSSTDLQNNTEALNRLSDLLENIFREKV